MKLNGFVGKGSGKLGASVFAISGGEQIVRQYNPQVANPNTDAQVAQRAKLKLMSQLAAALAPALGFAKQGLVSARNQFVSKNIGFCTFENNEAKIDLTKVTLTGGTTFIPDVAWEAVLGGQLPLYMARKVGEDVKAIVYVIASYEIGGQFRLVDVKVVTGAGERGDFPTNMTEPDDNAVIFAYGIKSFSSANGVVYNEFEMKDANGNAALDVIQKIIASGTSFSKSVAKAYVAVNA